MEVRNIGQEVMRLVYEWVDEDESEENGENNSASNNSGRRSVKYFNKIIV